MRYKYVGTDPQVIAGAVRQPGEVFGCMQEDQHKECQARRDVERIPDPFDEPQPGG